MMRSGVTMRGTRHAIEDKLAAERTNPDNVRMTVSLWFR